MTDSPKNKIKLLDPKVAEQIAAGEVIERPSSIVKECVENSLDANATEISVTIENGGKSLIEITDNGSGIPMDQLALSIRRHATSKIQSLEDLYSLKTLGFRGEALPSIAAVAELQLISKTLNSPSAYEFTAKGQNISHDSALQQKPKLITFGHFLGSHHGTQVRVQNLFSLVPVRLKFLKSNASEINHIRDWIERLALGNPQVGFQLFSEGCEILQFKKLGESPLEAEKQRVAELYQLKCHGSGQATNNLKYGSKIDRQSNLEIRAHWLQGSSFGQARKIISVINGRSVKDKLLHQAILASFKQSLLPGQFPAVALFLQIDPSQMDVNVHPSKTEVRFLDSKRLFQSIQSLFREMISAQESLSHAGPFFTSSAPWEGALEVKPEEKGSSFTLPTSTPHDLSQRPWVASQPKGFETQIPLSPVAPGPLHMELFHPNQFVGVLFKTYIVYDCGQELAILDQHAAHERIRFEKLKKQLFKHESQVLLIPEIVPIFEENRAAIMSRISWLANLGFQTTWTGENQLAFHAIPAAWGQEELHIRLRNLLDRLVVFSKQTDQVLWDETVFEKIALEACRSSIMAGNSLGRHEILTLTQDLSQCDHPWNCPHGRPTFIKYPRSRMEELFLRRP